MVIRIVLLLTLGLGLFIGCDTKQSQGAAQGNGAQPRAVTADSPSQQGMLFSQLSTFPAIADSAAFLSELLKNYGLKSIIDDNIDPLKVGKITSYEKLTLNGSNKNFTLVEYNWQNGSSATYPWKCQLLFSPEGKLIKVLSARRFELIKIFPDQPPFLLTCIATAKGNGGHELYKITGDTLENVYDGYNDYAIQTYSHHDGEGYQPSELTLSLKDANNDGKNDLHFTGAIIYKDRSRAPRHLDLVFLYDPHNGHFKAKEDYEKKYHLYD